MGQYWTWWVFSLASSRSSLRWIASSEKGAPRKRVTWRSPQRVRAKGRSSGDQRRKLSRSVWRKSCGMSVTLGMVSLRTIRWGAYHRGREWNRRMRVPGRVRQSGSGLLHSKVVYTRAMGGNELANKKLFLVDAMAHIYRAFYAPMVRMNAP